jgi:tRNA(Ile)-lysidine synthase
VEIVNYAVNNNLKWAEDETNYSAKYFRNRVRDFISYIPAEQRRQLLELNKKQTKLRSEIEIVLDDHCKIVSYRKVNEILRLSDDVALEILRQMTGRLTLPQLKRLLKNLRDARSGDIFQPGDGLQVGIYHGEMTVSKI